MTRRNQAKSKRTLRNVAIIFVCMIGVTLIGQFFISFSDNLQVELDDTASDGIEETYKEVGQLISEISQSRINYLEMMGDYFELTYLTPDTYQEVVSNYRELCGFTEFYMLNDDGNYMTLSGEQGYIDLGKDISVLTSTSQRSMIVDGSLPSKDEMIFYVVNLDATLDFGGYNFTSIAFGYDKTDMINSLKIDAYKGEGITYLTYDNGKIICRLDDQTKTNNVFTILKYSNITDKNYEKVVDDFTKGVTDTIKIKGDGTSEDFKEYYFSYQPLKYQEWILVSLVPTDVANSSMRTIRSQTSAAISMVFGGVSIILLAAIIFSFKNTIKDKDGMILQRNIVFDLVCNNLNEIYVLFNTKNKIVEYISPNIEKLTGISVDEFLDNPEKLLITHKVKQENLELIVEDFINKEMFDYRDDVYIDDTHGKKTLYNLNIYKQANSLFGIVVLSDRTEENRIRQELQDALDGANAANAAKSVFLSNVSHDMRTPMNAIIGFANLIDKDPKDAEKVLDYTSKIKLSSNHLLNLINEVLDYSKVEAGKTTLNIESTNIEVVVNSVDSIIRPQALEKDQKFNLTTNYFKHCNVKADELRLSQILINVLSNSIKYTPKGGTIDFKVDSKEYHNYIQYVFTIKDNGIGMSEEFVKTIFEPFSREESSVTNKIQGTGLGMSITKNLVDLMGGTITVESKKDVGSTFVITLHFEIDEETQKTNDTNNQVIDENNYSIKGLKILAAEDNALNQEIIKAILEAEEASIEVVDDGKKALERFETSNQGDIDVILMDVQMPVMNGYDATMAIRNSDKPNAKSIPIIAMTANAFIDDINNSLKAGMNGHVAKPINVDVLKKTIVECLNQSKGL